MFHCPLIAHVDVHRQARNLRRRAAACGFRSWRLPVIAHAVARRACAPTQRRAACSRACGERCGAGPRRPEQQPPRNTRRTIRAAELATSARAETRPETGQARSGVDRPACGGCATLPQANRALGPEHVECRDADEHERAAEGAELLTPVNTGAGVVSLNPATPASHRGRAAAVPASVATGSGPIAAVARP